MDRCDLAPERMVDLDLYPILDLEGAAGRALLAECQRGLRSDCACNLLGFLRPDAAVALAREAESLLPAAMDKWLVRTPYFCPFDCSLPPDHPRRSPEEVRSRQIAYCDIPPASGLNRLYLWDPLTEFIRRALGRGSLYRFMDRFQAVNLITLGEGGVTGWHYDYNDFTVTLLLQEPKAGGAFEYAPRIRTATNENYEEVKRAIAGAPDLVKTLERGAGTLTLFLGEYSLHRVTKVHGPRERVTAILLYDEVEGRVATEEVNVAVYGERARNVSQRAD
ncbi:MAG: hypothetical protein EXQ94_08475 [Alphaproteobacteria bacterium]|nr:hypothetical protein [Alphaproteobacteria bacterium]